MSEIEIALEKVILMRNDLVQTLYEKKQSFGEEWKQLLNCGDAWWWGNLHWIKCCPQRFDSNLVKQLPCRKPSCSDESNTDRKIRSTNSNSSYHVVCRR